MLTLDACGGSTDAGSARPASLRASTPSEARATGDSRLATSSPARGRSGAGTPGRGSLSPLGRSIPVRVRIPSIGVDSGLIPLGLQSDHTLEVPPNGFPAGWFTGAPTPGQLGPAVIAGHVHWDGSPGVFSYLERVRPGDSVTVVRRNGSVAVFTVTRVALYPKSTFPTSVVYGNIDYPGLRLITCGGLNAQTGVYDDNTVVFARLVGARHRVATSGQPSRIAR
jgi:sortase (surface protein transpeptidase)